MTFHKYSGAGNDFIVLDGRAYGFRPLCPSAISELCNRRSGFRSADGRIGADGLIILSESAEYDFGMQFFNPDGSTGMMCGNGGRCIAAFADNRGIGRRKGLYTFEAADGVHEAEIISKSGNLWNVRLKMSEPCAFREFPDGWFVDTGARHFVVAVADVDSVDVESEGSVLRHDDRFAPQGVNVDFVQRLPDGSLKIRTFEKGVEAETLACGTGITAAAAVARRNSESAAHYLVHARLNDLTVDFLHSGVYLTGPAELII